MSPHRDNLRSPRPQRSSHAYRLGAKHGTQERADRKDTGNAGCRVHAGWGCLGFLAVLVLLAVLGADWLIGGTSERQLVQAEP